MDGGPRDETGGKHYAAQGYAKRGVARCDRGPCDLPLRGGRQPFHRAGRTVFRRRGGPEPGPPNGARAARSAACGRGYRRYPLFSFECPDALSRLAGARARLPRPHAHLRGRVVALSEHHPRARLADTRRAPGGLRGRRHPVRLCAGACTHLRLLDRRARYHRPLPQQARQPLYGRALFDELQRAALCGLRAAL